MSRTGSDKMLIGIVSGIILIVIIALFVVSRRPQPEFQSQDTPESVVHDYLLALQLGNYERAYGLLSPSLAYPANTNEFYDSLAQEPWRFTVSDNYSQVVESSEPVSDNSVAVVVREIYTTNSLFAGNDYSELFRMRVENDGNGWRLVSGERYWSDCWGERDKCEDGVPTGR